MKVRKAKSPKSDEPAKSNAAGKPSAAVEAAGNVATPARAKIDLTAKLNSGLSGARSLFTPLRLVVLSLLTVVGLTGWWQWDRSARSSAAADFKIEADAGTAALQKGNHVEAEQHFRLAANAADRLQRTDSVAEQARQKHRQLTALNSLLSRSLLELIEAARAARLRENALAAESEFANLHAGRWLVLQGDVTPPTTPNASKTVLWEQQVQIFDEPLILTASPSVFSKISATLSLPTTPTDAPAESVTSVSSALNDLGQREVLFSAQVESLRWDAEKGAWVLTLKSSSVFLWTDYDLLLAIGLPPDELHTEAQLRAMLAEQSRWIGAAE